MFKNLKLRNTKAKKQNTLKNQNKGIPYKTEFSSNVQRSHHKIYKAFRTSVDQILLSSTEIEMKSFKFNYILLGEVKDKVLV